MRRLLLPALMVAVLAPLTPAAGQVLTYAQASQAAWADWVRLHGKTGTFYFALATRGADTFMGPHSVAYIGRGTCEVGGGKRFRVVACSGSARGRDVSLEEFRMDPLLASAHLRVGKGKRAHVVKWAGRGRAPEPGVGVGFGLGYADASAGLYRWAPAKGRLFGKRLKPGGPWHFGLLEQGTWSAAFLAPGMGEVRLLPDGTLEVTRRYRIPR